MDRNIPESVIEGIVRLASDQEKYKEIEGQAKRCGYCSSPIHLRGVTQRIDGSTGEITGEFSSHQIVGNKYLKSCGSRLATKCPACSATYKQDARQLISAGLKGGKGVPGSIATHPMIFATLTAPSFGHVHTQRGTLEKCRPGKRELCLHGKPTTCNKSHSDRDPLLGEALCFLCYDFELAVLWNLTVTELWRRTSIYLFRHLGKMTGKTQKELCSIARISYSKVVEFQRRGSIHLHVILRLDPIDSAELPGIFDDDAISAALLSAARSVTVSLPANLGIVRWGTQIDIRPIQSEDLDQLLRVANYLAKYATKGSDVEGILDRRFKDREDPKSRNLPPQLQQLVTTAFELSKNSDLETLKRWAHNFGFRGHFLTKSRRYSTTFGQIRREREVWNEVQKDAPLELSGDQEILSNWQFIGRGWQGPSDRILVKSLRQQYEESKRLQREAEAMR